MGKYKQGILGSFQGKIGTVIGSTWNGIDYMRALPKPSSKAPSDLQTEKRAKFGYANGMLGSIAAFLNLSFKSQAVGMTGFNVAISHLYTNAMTGAYPNFEVDYPKVLFSKGTLEPASSLTLTAANPNQVELSWVDNSGNGTAKGTDKVIVVAYNPTKSRYVYTLENSTERSQMTESLVMPTEFSGDTVHVYICLMTPDRKTFSTSMYAGSVVIQ